MTNRKVTHSTTKQSLANRASLKHVEGLRKEICKLKTKHEKAHTQWLTRLKQQVEKGAVQIQKMKKRIQQAKTISTRHNIAINLKAIHQKQGELKEELRELSEQYKKFIAQEKCLKRFETEYHRLEKNKTKL
jgi:hypothetical protein